MASPSTVFLAWLPVSVRCSDDVCGAFLTGACFGGCGRALWSEGPCSLLLLLRASGKLTHEVSMAIQRFGLEDLGDLAYSFSSVAAAEHAITDAWAYANTGASGEAASLAASSLRRPAAITPVNDKIITQSSAPAWKQKRFFRRGQRNFIQVTETPLKKGQHRGSHTRGKLSAMAATSLPGRAGGAFETPAAALHACGGEPAEAPQRKGSVSR